MDAVRTQCSPSRPKVPLIMQWNCAGLACHLPELSLFLRNMPVPILALSEAGLPSSRSISGYVAHKNQSIPTFPNGSAALYIRREIPHYVLPVQDLCSSALEVTAVQMRLGNRSLSVASVYVSSRQKVSMREIIRDPAAAARLRGLYVGTSTRTILSGVTR